MGDFKDQAWKWHILLLSYTIDQKSITQSPLAARMAGKYSIALVLGRRHGFVGHLANLCYTAYWSIMEVSVPLSHS